MFASYYYLARSGLNLTLYRACNATLGRWTNRDPVEERGGVNLYAYVDNNPVTWSDPSGLRAVSLNANPDPEGAVGGGGGGDGSAIGAIAAGIAARIGRIMAGTQGSHDPAHPTVSVIQSESRDVALIIWSDASL